MYHNFHWAFKIFFVKAGFVSAFPDCPTNRRTSSCVNGFTPREPFGYPVLILLNASRNIICTKAKANYPPNDFCNWTMKEQVLNGFCIMAE